MKIAILSRGKELYSTKRLKEAGEARGHQVDIIDTLHCYMDITANSPKVRYKGKELPKYDAVIPRIGASITFYGTSIVRQFEMMGSFCVNESVAISRSRDKLRSMQLLSRKNIGMPRTSFANKPDDIRINPPKDNRSTTRIRRFKVDNIFVGFLLINIFHHN